MMYLCDQCEPGEVQEFHVAADGDGDWYCANGHVQNWMIISGHVEAAP